MAPPEEVDVFKVPHRRMKELVNYYCQKLSKTDFSSNRDLGNLLKSLETTFSEFKIHEQIENDCIMNKLQRRLEALSIQNEQVCEVHSHNQLSEMLELVAQGYRLVQKGEGEMTTYGKELRVALEDFTRRFLPHMKEEEEVFQPLLMEYFSYEELKDIKSLVIKRHCLSKSKYEEESKEDKEKSDEDNKSMKCREEAHEEEAEEESPIQTLPSEILLRVMSYLSPRDLCRCAQVSRSWSVLARDGHLWQVMHPARWAQGDWRFGFLPDEDPDDLPVYGAMGGEEETDLYVVVDEDADFDESAESDDSESSNLSYTAACIQREAKMLTSMVRNLLPHVSRSVQSLVLRGSRGLTNGLVYKLIVSCPNLEYLDLSHTNVSDVAFKGLGKRGAGRKLCHLDLSGCVNITDLTLVRLSNGLGRLTSSNPGIPRSAENNKQRNNDVSKYICCDFSNAEGNVCCTTGTPYSSVAVDYPVPCHTGCAHSSTQFEDIECCEGFSERTSCVSEPPTRYQRTCCGGTEQISPPSPPNNDIASSRTCCMSREGSRPFQGDKNWRDSSSRRKNNRDNDYADNDNVGKRTNNCSPNNGDVDNDVDDAEEVTRGLVYLGLSGCYQITDDGLGALASHGGLPQLTHLDLSGCLNITADGLAALADNCLSLDHQQFFYCDNITDGPFSDTASGCQNLQCSSRVCCRSGE